MGSALARGLLDAGFEPSDIAIADREPQRSKELESLLPGARVAPNPAWAAGDADVVVLAVKPQDVSDAIEQLKPTLEEGSLVLSIAAGIPTTAIEAQLPDRPVVRAMPNTAAQVRFGVAAIAPGSKAEEHHLAQAEEVLGAVGEVVRVPETLLDAVTGLSGSGPAFVFLVAEALVEGGVTSGLSREDAEMLAFQTLRGASEMLVQNIDTPAELRAQVTSPGGTTTAGLQVLESRGVRGAIIDAVVAATERSKELGKK